MHGIWFNITMERVNSYIEDKVVFQVQGDMELVALALVVRGYAGVVRANAALGGEKAATEIEQAAENLAGRLANAESAITHLWSLGVHYAEVTDVFHILDSRLGDIAGAAVLAFSDNPMPFADYLSMDEIIDAQIYCPYLAT